MRRVPREVAEKVALQLGLSEDQLFDQYYRATTNDLTVWWSGFVDKLGEPTISQDWNSDPKMGCHTGLHVVWGHPFLALAFCGGTCSRFFRLPEGTIGELVSSPNLDGTFRAQSVILLEENELKDDASEFDQKILEQIALNALEWNARWAAVEKIMDQELLKIVALNDDLSSVRIIAIRKISDQKFLEGLLNNDSFSIVLEARSRLADLRGT